MAKTHLVLPAAVLCAALLVTRTSLAEAPRAAGLPRGAKPSATCTASAFHPIRVHVTALDPIGRGAVVRLRLSASSAVGLDQVQARLISAGGAENRGPITISLGALTPGRTSQGTFTVAIPRSGGRRYVEFEVAGQGPQGHLSRGACYNLLPDGPAEVGRTVVTPQGARLMEVAARRID